MDKVKKLISAGSSIPGAIKEALGGSVTAAADRQEVSRSLLSNAINGRMAPTDRVIDALIAELGGTPAEWRLLLWEAARPDVATATPVVTA